MPIYKLTIVFNGCVYCLLSSRLMLYNFYRNKLGANKQHNGLSWELINYRRVWFGQFIVEAKTLAQGHFFTPVPYLTFFQFLNLATNSQTHWGTFKYYGIFIPSIHSRSCGDQAGQLESQSAKELPYNVGRKNLSRELREPNQVLPCCSNCGNSLRGKVFMCQVGHKFCKTCLRKKKLESVDLILTCSVPCGMDILGRDKGMEDYLDILLHCRKPRPVFSK